MCIGVSVGGAVGIGVAVGRGVSLGTTVAVGGETLGVMVCDGSKPSDVQLVTITKRMIGKANLLDLII